MEWTDNKPVVAGLYLYSERPGAVDFAAVRESGFNLPPLVSIGTAMCSVMAKGGKWYGPLPLP